ncbi:hypothetical protein BKA80DRAFT_35398 [Phyllosticta citrichinensis]
MDQHVPKCRHAPRHCHRNAENFRTSTRLQGSLAPLRLPACSFDACPRATVAEKNSAFLCLSLSKCTEPASIPCLHDKRPGGANRIHVRHMLAIKERLSQSRLRVRLRSTGAAQSGQTAARRRYCKPDGRDLRFDGYMSSLTALHWQASRLIVAVAMGS